MSSSQSALALDPTALRTAFGLYPTGVVAVAAEVDGVAVGLSANSFTSVSLDPPLVSFSIARTSRTWPVLRRATRLGITVLVDHHQATCRQLAGPAGNRFDGVPYSTSADGAITLDEGIAHFHTSVHEEVAAGDHEIILLALHDVTVQESGAPLVFHRSTFGRLA
ncbi:flavin reductase family protein [Gordonia soli]|uniref:Putative oxidoreductase n=1 Tax=Gordonia soli NBRC 108243 TaxID=1223545 RepID=M0QIM3_9ACTN|nr:flavin reductase family protein [Gordonia soli]GAC68465.1 putative oxidoreductase [Gordonia soli NBRC 108243]